MCACEALNVEADGAAGPTPRSTEGGDHARSSRASPLTLRTRSISDAAAGAWLSLVPAHRPAVLPLASARGGLLLLWALRGRDCFLSPGRLALFFFCFPIYNKKQQGASVHGHPRTANTACRRPSVRACALPSEAARAASAKRGEDDGGTSEEKHEEKLP